MVEIFIGFRAIKYMIILNINGKDHHIEADGGELLVWVIHEKVGLVKTRFGCGIEMCGSCKVLVNGQIVNSCTIKAKDVIGKKIITKEGLPEDHPLITGDIENHKN